MAKTKLRKGDEVLVIKGKDRGRKGKIIDMNLDKGKAVVDGINIVKKAQRANPQKNVTGGLIDKPLAMDLSNLMLIDPATGKPGRAGYKVDKETGEKVRIVKPSKRKVTR